MSEENGRRDTDLLTAFPLLSARVVNEPRLVSIKCTAKMREKIIISSKLKLNCVFQEAN